jgi:hypothetical protein
MMEVDHIYLDNKDNNFTRGAVKSLFISYKMAVIP